MELRVLKYFLAVAREGNVSRAAESLNVTQPTLSRQLMDLEESLGVKLFIRGGHKITLTDAGMFLRKKAEEITELVYKTETELHTPDEIISGDIHIGCGETEGMRILAKISCGLHKDFPRICFNLLSCSADVVGERLDKGLLDFGVLVGLTDKTKYDYLRLPDDDIWGLLMRRDSPLASRKTIKPNDILDLPLISSRQSLESGEIDGWIKKDHRKLNFVATYNLLFNASIMVEEGLGYALGLDRIINTGKNSALCFRPLDPPLKAELYVVWKKNQVFSRAANLFLDRMIGELSL